MTGKVYSPAELHFDAAWDEDSEHVEVFLKVIEDPEYDCLDSCQVSGLPRYLSNMAENEWATENDPSKTVEEVKADMLKAGFVHRKIITWL